MQNPNRFTDDDRKTVLKCLAEEHALKVARKPYGESVILSCEMILRANPVVGAPLWYQQGDMA